VLGLVVLCGLWWWQADPSAFADLLAPAALSWIAAGVAAYSLGQALNGLAWRHLLLRAGGQVSLLDMALHDLSSVFWSAVLPGGVVGELIKGARLSRDADIGTVAVALLSARLLSGAVACLLALACLPAAGLDGAVQLAGAVALAATAAVGLGGLLAVHLGPGLLPTRWAARLPLGRPPAAADLGVAFGVGLLTHAAFAGIYMAGFAAAGAPLSFADAAVISALTSVAQLLPLSVGGVGVRELTISGLGGMLVTAAQADAGAVAVAAICTVFVLLGGLVELARGLRRR
jgi:uncharacterized membrane protein YbhN (UPF0104 family)